MIGKNLYFWVFVDYGPNNIFEYIYNHLRYNISLREVYTLPVNYRQELDFFRGV